MPQPPGTRPIYRVIDQTYRHVFRPDGTMGIDRTAIIEHASGARSEVTLPQEQYTAQAVHEIAQRHADTLAAVAGLPHTVTGA